MQRVLVRTYGCQMNVHDTEKVLNLLLHHGWTRAEGLDDASLLVINTCSIREMAQEKGFSQLGRWRMLKARRPDIVIGVEPPRPMSFTAPLPLPAYWMPPSRPSKGRVPTALPAKRCNMEFCQAESDDASVAGLVLNQLSALWCGKDLVLCQCSRRQAP